MRESEHEQVDWTDPVQATEAVEEQIKALPDPEAERLNDALKHLIDHMARRIEYAEHRRGAFATTAAGFIAAGIAIFAIVVRISGSPVRLGLTAFGVGLLLTGALVLTAWGQQTNPKYGFIRPETKLERPWKWFYRDALENASAFDFKWYLGPESERNRRGAREFDRQWGHFAATQIALEDLRKDLLQNLKQVYLLHVNERYKNLFLSQVRRLLVWGLIVTVFAGVLTGGIAAFCEGRVVAPSPSPAASVTAPPT